MATAIYTKYRKRRYKQAALLVDITINPDTIIYLSDAYRTVTNKYEGLLADVSGTDEHLPIDGRFRRRGNAKLKIVNDKLNYQAAQGAKFSDVPADYDLEGATVEIWQWFNGCAYTDCEPAYPKGTIIKMHYDENYVYLTVAPQIYDLEFPEVLTRTEYADLYTTAQGVVFPIIYGKVDNETTSGKTTDLTDYGGAIRLQYCIKHDPPGNEHNWLIAGHRCDDIREVYDDTTGKDPNYEEFSGSGNVCGGPSWRDICYVRVDTVEHGWGVVPDEDTCDVWGMESYGDLASGLAAGTLILSPVHCIEETLRLFAGKYDDDFGTTFNTVDTTDLTCRGMLTDRYKTSDLLTLFMKNFPIWFYHNRGGQLEYKRWTFNPAVDYTERDFSYDEDIKILGIELTTEIYNSVSLSYWRNHGQDIESAKGAHWRRKRRKPDWGAKSILQKGSVGGGDFFTDTFVNIYKQYSGKRLAEAIADTSDTAWLVDTGGMDPDVSGSYKPLWMIDREIFEIYQYNDGTGLASAYRRGACGTTASTHADNTPIYYLRTSSDDGSGVRDGHAWEDDADHIRIEEDDADDSTVQVPTGGAHIYADPERHAAALEDFLNADVTLSGTYTVNWEPEDNTFTISCDEAFEIISGSPSDDLPTVLGFTEDTGSGTSHTSDSPSYWREACAAYSLARYGTARSLELSCDLIRGDSMDLNEADATAIKTRNYWFDRYYRPRKRVRFQSSLVLADVELANIVEFNTDIDDHLKCHGASWSGLKWRVISIRRPSMYTLEFLVEEA